MWETFSIGCWLQSTYTFGGRVILNQNMRMNQLMALKPEEGSRRGPAHLALVTTDEGETVFGLR